MNHSVVDASALGLTPAPWQAIRGQTAADNAFLLRRILAGERGPHRDVVLLNSGAVLLVGGVATSLQEGISLAAQSIDDGQALMKLEALVDLSQELALDLQG